MSLKKLNSQIINNLKKILNSFITSKVKYEGLNIDDFKSIPLMPFLKGIYSIKKQNRDRLVESSICVTTCKSKLYMRILYLKTNLDV